MWRNEYRNSYHYVLCNNFGTGVTTGFTRLRDSTNFDFKRIATPPTKPQPRSHGSLPWTRWEAFVKSRFLLGFKMVNYRIRLFCQHQERTNERIIEFRAFLCTNSTKHFEQSGVYELECTSFVNLSQGYLIDLAFLDLGRGSSPPNLRPYLVN